MIDMKPCPRCEVPYPRKIRIHSAGWFVSRYYVECRFCHWRSSVKIGKLRAIKAWNKEFDIFKRVWGAGVRSFQKREMACLNQDEVIAFMKANPYVKVKHELFAPDEYLYMANDGFIYDENDYLFENWKLDGPGGFRYRKGSSWDSGWNIYKNAEG